MAKSEFIYVTYIKTSKQKLWAALTDAKTIKKYWFGLAMECDWTVGSDWKFLSDGQLMDSGKVLEIVPQKRLIRSWQNEWVPKMKKEGVSRCIYLIEPVGKSLKLTVIHSMNRANSKFIAAVSEGWPMCLSNLKSLLETGRVALKDHPGH